MPATAQNQERYEPETSPVRPTQQQRRIVLELPRANGAQTRYTCALSQHGYFSSHVLMSCDVLNNITRAKVD
jgi:hypothetical protein